ncbi:ArsR/SmtB family transcription factor [Spirosoma sp.]|uniref:ArsR/SmtB family transcription factor n=1 Tax=Spirosoma sp. TaxID=1899569 RepID=UPI003B3B51AA
MRTKVNSFIDSVQPVSEISSRSKPINITDDQAFDQAAELLKTLAHPLRIRLILLLANKRSMNVSALQRRLKVDQTTLSYQLTRMRNRGLLESVRQGKEIHYSLADSALGELMRLVLIRETV